MTIVGKTSASSTADKLERLAQLFRRQQASDMMMRAVDKLFSLEREESLRQLRQLEADLAEFETQYGMSSETFYQKYQAGETDDRMDFVEWASLIQMRTNLLQRLQLLDENGQE